MTELVDFKDRTKVFDQEESFLILPPPKSDETQEQIKAAINA